MHLVLVLGCFQVPQLVHDRICGIRRLSTGQYFAHLSGVESEHGILSEVETLIDLARRHFRRGPAQHAVVQLVWPVDSRDEGGIALIVRHGAQCAGILRHHGVSALPGGRIGHSGRVLAGQLVVREGTTGCRELPGARATQRGRCLGGRALSTILLLEKTHLFLTGL